MHPVEVWFSLIERQAIHRGTIGSVKDLDAKIRTFIDGWNEPMPPVRMYQDREEILKRANGKQTSNAGR